MEPFSEEEKKLLSRFMTNLDKPVFALINLPEVVKGALFSRYSRTTKSLRRVLLDEFIRKPEMGFAEIVGYATAQGAKSHVAIQKAEEFYDRVLVGYGDDSVAELASVHVAMEGISNIATKGVEDARIGLSPLEKSTRYVYFDQQKDGKWLYYEEPKIMESEFADSYVRTCDRLFETYARLIPKVSQWVTERQPQGDATDRAYQAAVRAKTCDILRGLLPAATRTNMGAMGNGRAWEYLLTRMYANELREMNDLAHAVHAELAKVIPSFVKRAAGPYGADMQTYWKEIDRTMTPLAANTMATGREAEVQLVEYDTNADARLVAYALYKYSDAPLRELLEKARAMSEGERKALLDAYVGKRGNRRQKPGRALENTYYTFDMCANFGAYRDLQRHRILTQERQRLGCRHGFALPPELTEASYADEFTDAMVVAKNTWERLAKKMPAQAQYAVPLAYRIRWYATLNLREAFHFCELRSMPQGHPDYRKIAQAMHSEIARVHPLLASYMNFVDRKEYSMERMEAEKKLDKKLRQLDEKYGGKKP